MINFTSEHICLQNLTAPIINLAKDAYTKLESVVFLLSDLPNVRFCSSG